MLITVLGLYIFFFKGQKLCAIILVHEVRVRSGSGHLHGNINTNQCGNIDPCLSDPHI